jgi:glycosyltransferase involved in cell wall biosynthesis
VKICFATEYYPPFAPGGAEWSNAALAEALGRRGHRVAVVTPRYGAARVEEAGGVEVRRVPFPVKLRKGEGEVSWLVHRNPLFYLYFAWQIWRIGRREGVDVIHAQNKGALVPAWLAARLLGRPVFVTVRDLGLLCPLGMCPLFEPWRTFDCTAAQYARRCVPFFHKHYHAADSATRRLRRWAALLYAWLDRGLRQFALRRVDGVICVSRGILEVFPERLVARERARAVYTLPPGVTPSLPAEVAGIRSRLRIGDGPLVLYAGKLSLGKGTGVFLEATDLIRTKVPGVRFALAGKGNWPVPEREDVHRLGSLPQKELFALYAAADVVVVPSIWPEPLSRVILEAMALGRAVVATAVGGSPEAVEDDVTGVLVPKGDAAALARAVSELLLDPERRRQLGGAARQRVASVFDETRLVTALLDAYRDLGRAS